MSKSRKITIAKDGPYLVSGSIPIAIMNIETNAKGESIKWDKETLCGPVAQTDRAAVSKSRFAKDSLKTAASRKSFGTLANAWPRS